MIRFLEVCGRLTKDLCGDFRIPDEDVLVRAMEGNSIDLCRWVDEHNCTDGEEVIVQITYTTKFRLSGTEWHRWPISVIRMEWMSSYSFMTIRHEWETPREGKLTVHWSFNSNDEGQYGDFRELQNLKCRGHRLEVTVDVNGRKIFRPLAEVVPLEYLREDQYNDWANGRPVTSCHGEMVQPYG